MLLAAPLLLLLCAPVVRSEADGGGFRDEAAPRGPFCGYRILCTAASCGERFSGRNLTFDLSSLTRIGSEYVVPDPEYKGASYAINVCAPTTKQCTGTNVSSIALQWDKTVCYSLGDANSQPTWELIGS